MVVVAVVVVYSRRRLGELLLAVVVVSAVRGRVAGGQVHKNPSNMGGTR